MILLESTWINNPSPRVSRGGAKLRFYDVKMLRFQELLIKNIVFWQGTPPELRFLIRFYLKMNVLLSKRNDFTEQYVD